MKIEYGISYANVYNLEDVMLEAIKIRRSIRTYINKKVEEENRRNSKSSNASTII